MSDDDELENDLYIWEHQGERLTVGQLIQQLGSVSPDCEIEIAFFDGRDRLRLLPLEMGISPQGEEPRIVTLTAVIPKEES
jgi:hypothetical protein